MLSDNKSAVGISMTPHGKIHKRHVALSFHRFRSSIASGIVTYQFIDGEHNPADMLSMCWAQNDIWLTLKPIIFCPEGTMECFHNDSLEQCGSSVS